MDTTTVNEFTIEVAKPGWTWNWAIYDAAYEEHARSVGAIYGTPGQMYRSDDGLVYPGLDKGYVCFTRRHALWEARRAAKKLAKKRAGEGAAVIQRYKYTVWREDQ